MPFDRLRRWQWLTAGTLFAGYAAYYVCRSVLSVAGPLLTSTSGGVLTKEEFGLLGSVGVVVYAAGKISNGLLTDALGGRGVFLLGMAASAGCTALFGLSGGLAAFLAVWAANRYVQSMGWGALVQVSSRWYPYRAHATVLGVLCMSYLIGDAFARWYLSQFVRAGLGWRELFFVASATLGATALGCAAILKSTPRAVGLPEPPSNPADLFRGEAASELAGVTTLLQPLLSSADFWIVCLMNAALTLIRETFLFWSPTWLTDAAGLDAASAAQGSMAFPLAGAVATLLAGAGSDRLQGSRGRVMLPLLGLLVGALLALAVVPVGGRPWVAILLMAAAGLVMTAPYSFCSGVLALDLGGKRAAATAAGLIDAAGYLGATLSGYGVAALAQRAGWPAAFAALAAVGALAAVAAAVYTWRQETAARRPPRQEPVPPEPAAV